MLRHISDNMKKMLIEELCKKYDNINMKLQDDLAKMWYDKWQLEEMESELKRIDEIINSLKED